MSLLDTAPVTRNTTPLPGLALTCDLNTLAETGHTPPMQLVRLICLDYAVRVQGVDDYKETLEAARRFERYVTGQS